MQKDCYFITGFPGFLSTQLMKELLVKKKDSEFFVVCIPTMVETAYKSKQFLMQETGATSDQITIIEGDITEKNCGIKEPIVTKILNKVTQVWHLAAIYDLAVSRDIAFKVNVEGTKMVNDLVKRIIQLKRYVYFSTAYVAGERKGPLLEEELIKPTSFHNYYEETKFFAEEYVEQLKSTIPTTIIRPGIVKGHSHTGETSKFDGPYFIMNMLDKLRFLPFLPAVGDGDSYLNIVPFDYVIKASIYFSDQPTSIGKTYHLTDPNPHTVREVYSSILEEMLNKSPKGKVPLWMVKNALKFKSVRSYLGVEREAVDYFSWNGDFRSDIAQQDLVGSGIVCPDFIEGVANMVAFYEQNKQNSDYHIAIH
ncbi:SDR family oxidoreductase [Bacillus spongiae]|uniref:SDR family oxidoreductase n=1 Tax=Bacillus spongiae TaxID=2683610 RepID=A0ABU8H9R4_9BACI